MINAQSIVVASTAAKWYGHEGDILRCAVPQSVALAALFIMLQADVPPFTTWMVP